MVEVILMGTAILLVDDVEGGKFGEDDLQEAATLQVFETDTRMWRHDDLIEFVLDALATDDLDSLCHPFQGHESLVLDLEVELGGESDAAHHAQGIVGEGNIGFQGCGDDTILEVSQAVEGIDEFAKSVFIQADSHCIDGKVTTVLVVLESPVFNDGFTRVVAVALLTGSYELHFEELRSQETGVWSR